MTSLQPLDFPRHFNRWCRWLIGLEAWFNPYHLAFCFWKNLVWIKPMEWTFHQYFCRSPMINLEGNPDSNQVRLNYYWSYLIYFHRHHRRHSSLIWSMVVMLSLEGLHSLQTFRMHLAISFHRYVVAYLPQVSPCFELQKDALLVTR